MTYKLLTLHNWKCYLMTTFRCPSDILITWSRCLRHRNVVIRKHFQLCKVRSSYVINRFNWMDLFNTTTNDVFCYLFSCFGLFVCLFQHVCLFWVGFCLFKFVLVRLFVFCLFVCLFVWVMFVCLFELVLCGLCVIISDDSGGNASLL